MSKTIDTKPTDRKGIGGRPRCFNSEEEIHEKVAEYKRYLKEFNKPATIAGLAYYLDVDRHTIYNYEKQDQYFHVIKRYRDWIIMGIEELCIDKGNGGTVFLAKNYGYTDKQEVEHSGKIEMPQITISK